MLWCIFRISTIDIKKAFFTSMLHICTNVPSKQWNDSIYYIRVYIIVHFS